MLLYQHRQNQAIHQALYELPDTALWSKKSRLLAIWDNFFGKNFYKFSNNIFFKDFIEKNLNNYKIIFTIFFFGGFILFIFQKGKKYWYFILSLLTIIIIMSHYLLLIWDRYFIHLVFFFYFFSLYQLIMLIKIFSIIKKFLFKKK